MEKAFDANDLSVVPYFLKKELKSRFKAEMYLYMAEKDASKITTTYRNAEGGSGSIDNFIERNLKNQTRFENDLDKILTKISADMKEETGKEVNKTWLGRLVGSMVGEFNK